MLKKKLKKCLLYVGLSYITKVDRLYLVGEFKPSKPPSENIALSVELEKLRQSPLIPVYQFLHDRSDSTGLQFIFRKVQGLANHHKDLSADSGNIHNSNGWLQNNVTFSSWLIDSNGR